MHQIEARPRLARGAHIGLGERDRGEPQTRRPVARGGEQRRVPVQPQHPALTAHPCRQQVGDAAAAAGQIQAPPAGGDADPVEQDARIGRHGVGLHAQPGRLGRAGGDEVTAGRVGHGGWPGRSDHGGAGIPEVLD